MPIIDGNLNASGLMDTRGPADWYVNTGKSLGVTPDNYANHVMGLPKAMGIKVRYQFEAQTRGMPEFHAVPRPGGIYSVWDEDGKTQHKIDLGKFNLGFNTNGTAVKNAQECYDIVLAALKECRIDNLIDNM